MSVPHRTATIYDLYSVKGKAELVNGEIVYMSPSGGKPGRAARKIVRSLEDYEAAHKNGMAFGDNVGFVVDLPKRKLFSPDAAFYRREVNQDEYDSGEFLKGAPEFAVEVRSKNDYGRKAEKMLGEKRADYFATGTLIVWDVDVLREMVVRVYRVKEPNQPTIYRLGDVAEAEPGVPGWTMNVSEIFS